MSAPPDSPIATRAELYARIRASSRDAVVLDEMQRLGFWPADDGIANVEADLIRREAELGQALQALGRELSAVEDPAIALKKMRKERMAAAKARREETRQRRAQERHARALAWHARKGSELLYLGEGVSAGLGETQGDVARLADIGLPLLGDAGELARGMGLTLQELRFLAFERRVSRISHYRRFAMPKKTGGERIISAPMPRLKRAQYWVLDNILARVPVHPAAHGFMKGRSIVSNALPHVGRAVVINLDLKDFFPSIAMPRIRGVFAQLGYSKQVATVLALLCTESVTEAVSVDGETFHVADGPRVLPQGAPSSPALTNILCRRLDARLQGAAAKLGFAYTRYADDLSFSGGAEAQKLAGKLLWRVKQIVADEGFTPHPEKQHVMRRSHRQSVTGVVVNDKPSVERETLRRFRATLHQVEKDGPTGKHWNGNQNVINALEGYAQFIHMVDAAKGAPLLAKVRAVRAKWQGDAQAAPPSPQYRGTNFRALSVQGKAPWAGFWQAGAAPAPILEKTQEQITLEKKQAREQSRTRLAEDKPASEAAMPTRATPASTAPAAQAPIRDLALQCLLGLALTLAFRQVPIMFVTAGLVWLSHKERHPHWKRFGAVMAALALALSLR